MPANRWGDAPSPRGSPGCLALPGRATPEGAKAAAINPRNDRRFTFLFSSLLLSGLDMHRRGVVGGQSQAEYRAIVFVFHWHRVA